MAALSMVGTGRPRPPPKGGRSDRTQGGGDGSGGLRTSPPGQCSTVGTAGASLSPIDTTLWGPDDCETGSRPTHCCHPTRVSS